MAVFGKNLYGRNSGKGDAVHWSGLFNVDSSTTDKKSRWMVPGKKPKPPKEKIENEEEGDKNKEEKKEQKLVKGSGIELPDIGKFFADLDLSIGMPNPNNLTFPHGNFTPSTKPSSIGFDLGYTPAKKGMKVPTYENGGLYANINKRKKAGTSRSKKDSTISKDSYKNMQKGFSAKSGIKLNKKPNNLTPEQMKTLEKHKEHHTKEHMDMMIQLMKNGKTFNESHNIAKKKVGK
tara:strand:+ start:588 stop:1289 length:702 start_codon:yes stop_codon:yes gene_type:complete